MGGADSRNKDRVVVEDSEDREQSRVHVCMCMHLPEEENDQARMVDVPVTNHRGEDMGRADSNNKDWTVVEEGKGGEQGREHVCLHMPEEEDD